MAFCCKKRIADNSSPDSEDISNLYQNNGYLFSNINPVETKTEMTPLILKSELLKVQLPISIM